MKKMIEQLKEILEKSYINDNLREAVKATVKALEDNDLELAFELTAVKSLICTHPAPPEYHFTEETEKNREALGRSIYGFLDSMHYLLATKLQVIPSGMTIISGDGLREKALSSKQHPIVVMITEELTFIRESARMEAKRRGV